MSLRIVLFAVPLMLTSIGCGESKKEAEPVKPAAHEPARDTKSPPKVDVHITTETQPATDPKRSGLSVTVEAEADLEVK